MAKQQYNNQFTFEIERCRFLGIDFDDYITFPSDQSEHRKVVAAFEAVGESDNSDVIAITFFDDRAEIIADRPEGTEFYINCKVSTKYIQGEKGEFSSTNILGFFVREFGSKKQKEDSGRRSGGRNENAEKKSSSRATGTGATEKTGNGHTESRNSGRSNKGRS